MNIFQKIKLGLQLIGEVKKMKSGFLTTEFWMSVITVIGLIAGVFIGKIPAEALTLAVPIITGLYIIARTIVKASATTVDDEILEKIEKDILEKLPGYVPPAHE